MVRGPLAPVRPGIPRLKVVRGAGHVADPRPLRRGGPQVRRQRVVHPVDSRDLVPQRPRTAKPRAAPVPGHALV